jgi:hypothetical protein
MNLRGRKQFDYYQLPPPTKVEGAFVWLWQKSCRWFSKHSEAVYLDLVLVSLSFLKQKLDKVLRDCNWKMACIYKTPMSFKEINCKSI